MNNGILLEQIMAVYKRFDPENKGKVTLRTFKEVVVKEPHLLEIFDYARQGFHDSLNPFSELPPRLHMLRFGIEDLKLKLTRICRLLTNPDAQEEEEEEGYSEYPKNHQRPQPRPIITSHNDKQRSSDVSGGKISAPALRKLRSIRGTIFLEPLKQDLDRLSNSDVVFFLITKSFSFRILKNKSFYQPTISPNAG